MATPDAAETKNYDTYKCPYRGCTQTIYVHYHRNEWKFRHRLDTETTHLIISKAEELLILEYLQHPPPIIRMCMECKRTTPIKQVYSYSNVTIERMGIYIDAPIPTIITYEQLAQKYKCAITIPMVGCIPCRLQRMLPNQIKVVRKCCTQCTAETIIHFTTTTERRPGLDNHYITKYVNRGNILWMANNGCGIINSTIPVILGGDSVATVPFPMALNQPCITCSGTVNSGKCINENAEPCGYCKSCTGTDRKYCWSSTTEWLICHKCVEYKRGGMEFGPSSYCTSCVHVCRSCHRYFINTVNQINCTACVNNNVTLTLPSTRVEMAVVGARTRRL